MDDDSPSDTPELSPIEAKHFRNVLGHFPTGVTVVTAMAGELPVGFTIGSFTSVSLDPPLVGFLPMKSSETWQAIAPGGTFCVNVLRQEQGELCWRFAKTGLNDDQFADLDWTRSPLGNPILPDSGAWIDCHVDQVVDVGDHHFVVGAVAALDHHADPHIPLIFYRGTLGMFAHNE